MSGPGAYPPITSNVLWEERPRFRITGRFKVNLSKPVQLRCEGFGKARKGPGKLVRAHDCTLLLLRGDRTSLKSYISSECGWLAVASCAVHLACRSCDKWKWPVVNLPVPHVSLPIFLVERPDQGMEAQTAVCVVTLNARCGAVLCRFVGRAGKREVAGTGRCMRRKVPRYHMGGRIHPRR